MASGENTTFWIVSRRDAADGTPDIHFQSQSADCPQEQLDLKKRVEKTLTIVRRLYAKRPDTRSEYVDALVALSQVGMVGKNASPKIGTGAIEALEEEILANESGPIKNAYMRVLGLWALTFGTISLFLAYVSEQYPQIFWERLIPFHNLLIVWSGCMVGSWLSFATRKSVLKLGDLIALEEDKVQPKLRLIFVGMLALTLSAFILSGMADVTIGTFKASHLLNSGLTALAFGVLCGLAEKALPSVLMNKASELGKSSS